MQNRHLVRHCVLGMMFITVIGFLTGTAYAEDVDANPPFRPWVNQPSRNLAAKLRHWRLKFELGEVQSAPEKGIFPSFAPGYRDGTARLINDLGAPTPVKLTPVAHRTRYVPGTDPRTDPADKVVTKELMDVLRSPEIVKFIAAERLYDAQLDLGRDIAVVLVQDFEVALRAPRRKEHVWSINWRLAHQTDTSFAGYEAWGLFTRVRGALKPFYLAGRKSRGETPGDSYYYALAVGDLDGDGTDELVVREMGFEKEEDDLEIWAWERGAPVTIHKMPW